MAKTVRALIQLNKSVSFEVKARYTEKQNHAPRVVTPQQLFDASQAGIDLFAQDNTNFDFAAPPAGYWLLNISAGYSFNINQTRWDWRLAAENLLNTTYRDYTNRFRYYSNAKGRNVILSLQINF